MGIFFTIWGTPICRTGENETMHRKCQYQVMGKRKREGPEGHDQVFGSSWGCLKPPEISS